MEEIREQTKQEEIAEKKVEDLLITYDDTKLSYQIKKGRSKERKTFKCDICENEKCSFCNYQLVNVSIPTLPKKNLYKMCDECVMKIPIKIDKYDF